MKNKLYIKQTHKNVIIKYDNMLEILKPIFKVHTISYLKLENTINNILKTYLTT
jgi:hypothetical protein